MFPPAWMSNAPGPDSSRAIGKPLELSGVEGSEMLPPATICVTSPALRFWPRKTRPVMLPAAAMKAGLFGTTDIWPPQLAAPPGETFVPSMMSPFRL